MKAKMFDYNYGRPMGTDSEFERIVDSESPVNADGTYAGGPDMFKLEYSGWVRHVEFKLKEIDV